MIPAPLDRAFKKTLIAKAHRLSPVVQVGIKGITPAVLAEIEAALTAHALIKVQLPADRDQRAIMIPEILSHFKDTHAIQTIGRRVVFYRPEIN